MTINLQTGELPPNHGMLSVVVWPPYVGLASGDPGNGPVALNEPYDDANYARAMIAWRTEPSGVILGSATVSVPKGIWTHVVFFAGPQRDKLMGCNQFEQPVVFDRPGFVELDPIHNQDVLPRGAHLP